MINENKSQKQKWISDAAYYKSLQRNLIPESQTMDWLEAENEYKALMDKRVKSGLVRMVDLDQQ